jgi:hypothetical protein
MYRIFWLGYVDLPVSDHSRRREWLGASVRVEMIHLAIVQRMELDDHSAVKTVQMVGTLGLIIFIVRS